MKPQHSPLPGKTSRTSLRLAVALALGGCNLRLLANPSGMTLVSGSATPPQTSGSVLNINVGSIAVLNWNSFNIQPGETTRFNQPSANSVVFNNIGGANPSQIWGNLTANGTVILANANGFSFGPNSMINVGGSFLATTAPIRPDFGAGTAWQFTGMPPAASIVNYGQISVGNGHSLFLIAEHIENHGELNAPAGNVGLYAGQDVLVSERPDGRGLSANVRLPAGSVDNSGKIIADAGTIALRAQVVNQNGIIQADSVREQNGVIELVASDQLNLGANSQILARGDDSSPNSPGGRVTLKSGNQFSDSSGSEVVTRGGAQGGNGGNVEISAPNIQSLNSSMDAGAQTGFTGGQLLLDPTEIVLAASGNGSAGNGDVAWNSGSGTLQLNVNTAFLNKNFSQITLQASDNITISTAWDLTASTGLSAGQLTLQAGHNIIFGNGSATSHIVDANNWSVNLQAGVNFTTGAVQPGIGSIYLNGGAGQNLGGFIQTAQGSISLTAGQDILVGPGWINTTAGGSIVANALSGSINAGTSSGGYAFTHQGYYFGAPHGVGISTINGGDVTLDAGQNVTSIPNLSTTPAGETPGASGAYGSQAGNVTVIAGNQILGNFLVRNGTGLLEAGVTVQNGKVTQILNPTADIGSATQPVRLSLISGNWEAWAANNAYIGEVNNPNGIFNYNPLPVAGGTYAGNVDGSGTITQPPTRQAFLFDYAPGAGASFWAGNSITLGSANLPRVSGDVGQRLAIYPPRLSLEAGAGGITVDNPTIILYPSSQGSLSIVTHDGGNLNGVYSGGGLSGITMSDSGLPDWSTFGAGHAVTPLHLNDPNLVRLNISAGIENFALNLPTAASITAQNTYNFNFTGQNLSPLAVTSINIAGNITYRGYLTSVTLTDPFPSSLLDPVLSPNQAATANLHYDSSSHTLSFVGQMSAAVEAFLLNPSIFVLDGSGQPVLDANGAPETTPVTLSAAQQTAIQQLYTASQTASLSDTGGLNLNGPGRFSITAQNMDLGISGGINVNPVPLPSLTAISPYGASLDITLTGNLEMTSTRIENGGLANEGLLGGIQLEALSGTVDVGLQSGGYGAAARGIYTSGGGTISVTANGNINVDGSRIAAFDGGNLNITTLQGDVNAGAGGNGSVTIDSFVQLDSSGNLETVRGITMYGSGLIATTVGESTASLGNITVQAPHGSINANLGGIEQVAFNQNTSPNNFIELDAGNNIEAGNSGVIGSNIRAKAGGSISGVFIGSGDVNINAANNFSGTVVGSTAVSINAGGTVSGTVVGGTGISVSGGTITASLISTSVSASGDVSAASVGVPSSNVPKQDAKVAEDASTTVASSSSQDSDTEENGKKKKAIALAQKTGRVTVILPSKNSSKQNP